MNRPDYKTPFAVFDTEKNEWMLDCFDYIRDFGSQEAAQKYCDCSKNPRYEIRPVTMEDYKEVYRKYQ